MREWMHTVCACISECISAKRETASQNLVEKAKRFIAEHYQDNGLSVDRLCEHLHVSQSYFSAVFRQETGTSYVQYLTKLRLDHACELLLQTDEKTYEIARRVGYEEPNYFSYVFKKSFGVSPTKYRNR
jgi:two-component system response regulator YesN